MAQERRQPSRAPLRKNSVVPRRPIASIPSQTPGRPRTHRAVATTTSRSVISPLRSRPTFTRRSAQRLDVVVGQLDRRPRRGSPAGARARACPGSAASSATAAAATRARSAAALRRGGLRSRRAPAAAAAQREVRNERDAFAGAVVDDLVVPSLGEVVLVLDGGDRHHLASRADLLDAHLGDADVADSALVAVLGDHAEALLERRLWVDAVQVVEGDRLGAQSPKALLDLRTQHLRAPFARV